MTVDRNVVYAKKKRRKYVKKHGKDEDGTISSSTKSLKAAKLKSQNSSSPPNCSEWSANPPHS